jgi:prepilin-type N-terminal cleavage/methylation domain-containing protein
MTLAMFSPPIRNPRSGFTLLEALIALALVALVAGIALQHNGWAGSQQKDRLERLYMLEFARSVLEEYKATYPQMLPEGQVPGSWHWQVTETLTPTIDPPLLGIVYVDLKATVWLAETPSRQAVLTTRIARRIP